MKASDRLREKLEHVKKVYVEESDVCMSELLGSMQADGLSIEEAFYLYISAMVWSDGDAFFVKEGCSLDNKVEEIEVEF